MAQCIELRPVIFIFGTGIIPAGIAGRKKGRAFPGFLPFQKVFPLADNEKNTSAQTSGAGPLLVAFFTFVLWGVLPVYWKIFGAVPAPEVLGHRILWSFVFTFGLIVATGRLGDLKAAGKRIWLDKRKLAGLMIGSVLISMNWLTFIWAVNHDLVVESSLGYYINPLLNVLIGVTILRERLSLWQAVAVLLAFIGVAYLSFSHGSVPIVALILSGTMSVYGLVKKITGLSALIGMTLETAVSAPLALVYFIVLYSGGGGYPIGLTPVFLCLLGAGAVTSVPLVMFAYSLNRLPYSLMGIFQYIAPTLTLLLGVFVYGEAFTRAHMISFTFIWSALVLFTVAKTAPLVRLERGMLRRGK